jgi:RimJ/RimL family protein N-acetyltransferase
MNDDELPAFTSMPTSLTTDRLMMRPFSVDDAPLHAEMISERGPGARHYGATVAAVEQLIERLLREAGEHGFGLYVVERVDDVGFVGYCGLIVGDGSIGEPEIAYELLSRFHGRGYATETASAVVAAARATGRRRLVATVGPTNAASLRVLKKVGFVPVVPAVDGHDGHVAWERLL